MALAYTLDIEDLQNIRFLSQVLIELGEGNPSTPLFGPEGLQRFLNPSFIKDIFPTGEYIIRDGMYINGLFVYVGSYRAYMKDLFGAGNNGYAWDGFIMVFRGYNLNSGNNISLFSLNPNTGNYEAGSGTAFGFIPMRLPLTLSPGNIGDANAISTDSAVGLHSLDIFKFPAFEEVESVDVDIRIITCGFQRVNPTTASVPTGMDYVGCLFMGTLLTRQNIADVDGVRFVEYSFDSKKMMQITWQATVVGNGDNSGSPMLLRDLDVCISANLLATSLPYAFEDWTNGETPVSYSGGDVSAKAYNFFPRRFMDVSAFSFTSANGIGTGVESPFYIVGDFSLDTNNDGSVDTTGPAIIGCAYPFFLFQNATTTPPIAPSSFLGPYMMSHVALITSLSVEPTTSWFKEDTTPSYSLAGAVASLVTIPYETTTNQQFDTLPATLIAVNDVTHGGVKFADVYFTEVSPLAPALGIQAYMTENGIFTTTTGIQLANKFTNKAIQFRTFTTQEESIGKVGSVGDDSGDFSPTAGSVFDFDTDEYVGIVGNYQRYGSFINPTQPNQPQGTLSGAAYGFLGNRTGVGPIAIMFDSGSPLVEEVSNPSSYAISVRAEGENINSNHLVNPTSTTRDIIQCGWDNDRDQWLFMTGDTSGVGVISVSSDFSTASNNVGFLDQTKVFKLPNTVTAGLYTAITMSNSMDGWTFFGVPDTDPNVRFGVKPPVLGPATTATYTPKFPPGAPDITWDVYRDNTTYLNRIIGTTGRTARVWIDYVLFDGVDSVIAKKLREFGIKVTIDNVEWFKRKIIRSGDLNIKSEEIEVWMREQQTQYTEMLKDKERNGRIRKRKSQVSAYSEGMEEQINPDFMDSEVKDHLSEFIPEGRPPTEQDRKLEKKRKGGYEPETKSYYDDVFDDTE